MSVERFGSNDEGPRGVHSWSPDCRGNCDQYVKAEDYDIQTENLAEMRVDRNAWQQIARDRGDRLSQLEAALKDARYLVVALVKKAGGRVEMSMVDVLAMDLGTTLSTWNDPATGCKVYQVISAETFDEQGEKNG